ncbi:MAG: nitroreductase family protein [Acholeplasmataceae bacterium]
MVDLEERRSIRVYDPTVRISREEMREILRKATRAPSSMNMQPWRFVVVESEQGKKKLKEAISNNDTQLETSAAMILIMTDLRKYDYAKKIYDMAYEAEAMPKDVRDRQIRSIANMVPTLSPELIEKSGLIDCGLVAMQLMHVAREHGYDTCPIGGFDHERILPVLGLDDRRYRPVLIVSIGKRAEDGYPSLRLPVDDVTTWL